MYQNDITNICMDKYYNELILTNTDINLKNVNYSKNKLIIKNIIKKNDLKKISIFNYNLFEEFCINGNYIMIKWMCLKYKFNKSFIYFSSSNKILNNRENVFLEKYIGYSVINNNLKMLKFGKHFDRKNFMSYLKHRMSSIPNNDTKILKWITKYENEFTIKKIYKNFNINYYYDI